MRWKKKKHRTNTSNAFSFFTHATVVYLPSQVPNSYKKKFLPNSSPSIHFCKILSKKTLTQDKHKQLHHTHTQKHSHLFSLKKSIKKKFIRIHSKIYNTKKCANPQTPPKNPSPTHAHRKKDQGRAERNVLKGRG